MKTFRNTVISFFAMMLYYPILFILFELSGNIFTGALGECISIIVLTILSCAALYAAGYYLCVPVENKFLQVLPAPLGGIIAYTVMGLGYYFEEWWLFETFLMVPQFLALAFSINVTSTAQEEKLMPLMIVLVIIGALLPYFSICLGMFMKRRDEQNDN